MSLMDQIRQGTDSGGMKIFLVVVFVVFVFWGIGNQGPTSSTIAEVNGTRITDTSFHKLMRRASSGEALDKEQQNALERQVIRHLISKELLQQEAKKLGIEVSGDEVATVLFDYSYADGEPIFVDENGTFQKSKYEEWLKRTGQKSGAFEEEIRLSLIGDKLATMVAGAVTVEEDEIRKQWLLSSTNVTLETIRITPLSFYDEATPDPIILETFIAENGPEIHTWYEKQFESRYHKPRRAKARMILLKADMDGTTHQELKTKAEAVYQEASSGTPFEELAKKYSEDATAITGGFLGEIHRKQLDPVIADSIFGTSEEPIDELGIRPLAETQKGFHIILVEELMPEVITPEDDVKEEIATILLRESGAPKLAATFAEDLRIAWKTSNEAPLEMLEAQGLKVDQMGPAPIANSKWLNDMPEITAHLETASNGDVLDKVFTTDGAWFVVRLVNKDVPEESTYQMMLPYMKAQALQYKQQEFLQEWQDDLLARAKIVQNYNP